MQESAALKVHKLQKLPHLTVREFDILHLLFSGLTNREIGARLYLSPLTVRNYISQLLIKFEARNRTDLLAKFVSTRRYNHKNLLP